LKKEDVK